MKDKIASAIIIFSLEHSSNSLFPSYAFFPLHETCKTPKETALK
jgi:hypothetical protein